MDVVSCPASRKISASSRTCWKSMDSPVSGSRARSSREKEGRLPRLRPARVGDELVDDLVEASLSLLPGGCPASARTRVAPAATSHAGGVAVEQGKAESRKTPPGDVLAEVARPTTLDANRRCRRRRPRPRRCARRDPSAATAVGLLAMSSA